MESSPAAAATAPFDLVATCEDINWNVFSDGYRGGAHDDDALLKLKQRKRRKTCHIRPVGVVVVMLHCSNRIRRTIRDVNLGSSPSQMAASIQLEIKKVRGSCPPNTEARKCGHCRDTSFDVMSDVTQGVEVSSVQFNPWLDGLSLSDRGQVPFIIYCLCVSNRCIAAS